MRTFNVTQIVPPGHVHAHALDDIAEYLAAMLAACGHAAVRTSNHVELRGLNVIVGAHLLADDHVAGLPPSTVVFNSEQLSDPDPRLITPAYRRALDSFRVWDYTPTNLPFVGHARVTVIPFGGCPAVVRSERVREAGDALVFHGSITPHRQRVLAALHDAGIRVEVAFGEYGRARDLRIFRARAVLNLHKAADTIAFEPVRCFYPLNNSIPVISVATDDPAAEPFRDAMWFFAADELAAGITALWTDPTAFAAEAARRTARFRARTHGDAFAAAVAALP